MLFLFFYSFSVFFMFHCSLTPPQETISITVSIENAILPAGSNPFTSCLKAVVQHPSLIVEDILSNTGVEFEASFAISLRPKCAAIPNGLHINWRSFLKQNLSLWTNVNMRMPDQNQSSFEPDMQRQQCDSIADAHLNIEDDTHCSGTIGSLKASPNSPKLLPQTDVLLTDYTNGIPSDLSLLDPVVVTKAEVFSNSMWTPSAHDSISCTFPLTSLQPLPNVSPQQQQHLCAQHTHQLPQHQSQYLKERVVDPANSILSSFFLLDPLEQRTVMFNEHSYLRRNCTFHESEACKICTSTEHSFEEHTSLLKKSRMCKKPADMCAYGPACVFSHAVEEQSHALAVLSEQPYVFNSDNMCYYSKPSRHHPAGSGYHFYVGCGSVGHTVNTSGGSCY
jgi:hypothetical protein